MLASRGFKVELASGKGRTRPVETAENFNLVVLDLTGSDLDLPEVSDCIVALPDSAVVVVGGNLGFHELSEALGHRVFHLFKHAWEAEELVAAMQAAIRQQQLLLENRALRARLEGAEERTAAERLANFRANHDLLTRLPNRALLNDRLENAITQARRNERKLALMFLDLDGFKSVNDSLGHDLGDRLLKAVADRLGGCVRRSDTLARFGGDEFALLLPDVRAPQDAALIAEKILGRLDEPFVIAGHRLSVGTSIGIAMYPEAGNLGELLIRKADIAMYHVKGQGKHAYRFYSEEMDPKHPRQLATERELHGGLIRGELEVHYRPRVSLANGRVTAVEAAWRWRHPERGLVEPADIVPTLATGAYNAEVDDFLHKQAFRQAVEWRRGERADLRLAVNLLAARLAQPGFVEHFAGSLLTAGLDPEALTVQIDENALMEAAEVIAPRLQELQDRGIRVVVSDFGAGFSSLRYLDQLSVSGLKLTPSLLRDYPSIGADLPAALSDAPQGAPQGTPTAPGGTPTAPGGTPTAPQGTPTGSAARTVAAIAAAAEQLGLDLIAAGVETPGQFGFLKSCGVQEADGPVFSRALPAVEVQKVLHDDFFAPLVGV